MIPARRRAVVTGIGLVTPLGVGLRASWEGLLAGRSGARTVTRFDPSELPTTFACEVPEWEPERFLDKRLARTVDRYIQFALAAALMARDDAGLPAEPADPERVGTFIGSGMGGILTIEETHRQMMERGARRAVSPYFVPAIIVNMAAGQASILLGAQGPSMAHASACSSAAHSLGEALRCIERDDADVVYAGGGEATICKLGMAGFCAMKAMSRRNAEPERASRPFDRDRDGFVMGEGAGVLVLEELEHARRRGARVYAELAGYGCNSDAFHITSPAPGGAGARRCIQLALKDAGVSPEEIGYINAHGTSTPQNDVAETEAIKAAFGEHARRLMVSSTKSMTGHLLGASGGLETAVSALALHHGVVPPTINLENPDPACDLDYVPGEARTAPLQAAMSNSFGFGGTNACLVLRRI